MIIAAATDPELGFPAWLRVTHFLNFLFLGLLGPQRLGDHRDAPALLLAQRLRPRHGVDQVHQAGGASGGGRLHGPRRRVLPVAADLAAWPQEHRGRPALARAGHDAVGAERSRVRRTPLRHRPVAPSRADVVGGLPRGVGVAEDLRRPRRAVDRALPAVRRTAAADVLLRRLRRGPADDRHRPGHVAGRRGTVPVVPEALRRTPGCALAALPRHGVLHAVHRHPRDAGLRRAPEVQPDPHDARRGQPGPVRAGADHDDPRHRRRRGHLAVPQLLEPRRPPSYPGAAEPDHRAGPQADRQPVRVATAQGPGVDRGRHLALPLGACRAGPGSRSGAA